MQQVLAPIIGPKKELHDLTGKVALITGGANGIGYEVARGFVSVGCRVIMTNRKEEQGEQRIQEIKRDWPDAKIEWVGCDLGTLSEVKKVFTEIAEKEERLDLLVLSAGINSDQFGLSNDKIDRHFQVNWLGHFYIINLLYPLLRKTSQIPGNNAPKVIFESSEMHRTAPSNVHYGSLAEINDETIGNTQVYGRTKLAMILGARALVEKVVKKNNDDIYFQCVHPGAINTQMQQSWKTAYPGITGKIISAVSLAMGRSPEQGSYSALWVATSPKIEEQGEKFFYWTDPDQPGKESAQANDKWLGEALWDLSHRLIKQIAGDDALKPWDK